jgi:hypothetical protein
LTKTTVAAGAPRVPEAGRGATGNGDFWQQNAAKNPHTSLFSFSELEATRQHTILKGKFR